MSNFTVRIELHGAKDDDYDTLHQRMEKAGYSRSIAGTAADGTQGTWQLPTAEYDYTGDYTAKAICDHAKGIADTVKPNSWCLVTQVADRYWHSTRLKAAA